jgi:sarcosine oxidase subunit alpha
MAENVAVTLVLNGRPIRVRAGITVAAALAQAGMTAIRASVRGEPRSVLCGMGICYECRATIDGTPHRRTCMMQVADGMRVETSAGGGHA